MTERLHPAPFTSQCSGKKRFDSAKLAHETVKARNAKHNRGKRQAYRCRFCGGWHLGHAPARSLTEQRKRAMKAIPTIEDAWEEA